MNADLVLALYVGAVCLLFAVAFLAVWAEDEKSITEHIGGLTGVADHQIYQYLAALISQRAELFDRPRYIRAYNLNDYYAEARHLSSLLDRIKGGAYLGSRKELIAALRDQIRCIQKLGGTPYGPPWRRQPNNK